MHKWFWFTLALWLVCDLYILAFHNKRKVKKNSEHHSKYVMILLILVGMSGGLLISPESREAFLEPFVPLRYLSIPLLILGIILRVTAVIQLGKFFSVDVELSNGNGLYKKGLYSVIRHPSYLGEILCFTGVAVGFYHPVTSFFAFLFPLAAFFYRIRLEEAFLEKHFGDEYRAYAAKTKRLLPFLY